MKRKSMVALALAFTLLFCVFSVSMAESNDAAGDVITIYIVRHGKTFFNTTDQVQGFADSPLTEVGIEQAERAGKGLADITFVKAYCGELGRQRKTEQLILAENNNPIPEITEDVGFNEWNYGGYEGKMNEEMWNPIFADFGYEFDPNWTHYNDVYEQLGDRGIADAIAANDELGAAETYDEILARASAAMNRLVEETQALGGGNVLVVSSGGQTPTILEMLVPEQYNGEGIDNCSLTILTYQDGQYNLELVGDTTYME